MEKNYCSFNSGQWAEQMKCRWLQWNADYVLHFQEYFILKCIQYVTVMNCYIKNTKKQWEKLNCYTSYFILQQQFSELCLKGSQTNHHSTNVLQSVWKKLFQRHYLWADIEDHPYDIPPPNHNNNSLLLRGKYTSYWRQNLQKAAWADPVSVTHLEALCVCVHRHL